VAEGWLTVKALIADADGSAIFQKIITTAPNAGVGQIENDGAQGVCIVRFDILAANTLALTADAFYYYDIQLRLSTADILTLESGQFAAQAQVTIDV
jgi:hypothetical protein